MNQTNTRHKDKYTISPRTRKCITEKEGDLNYLRFSQTVSLFASGNHNTVILFWQRDLYFLRMTKFLVAAVCEKVWEEWTNCLHSFLPLNSSLFLFYSYAYFPIFFYHLKLTSLCVSLLHSRITDYIFCHLLSQLALSFPPSIHAAPLCCFCFLIFCLLALPLFGCLFHTVIHWLLH